MFHMLKEETYFTEDNTKYEDPIICFCGVLFIWIEIKSETWKYLEHSRADSLTENISTEPLFKSLVSCCVFAAVHENKFREFTKVSQGDRKAHSHWNSQDLDSYPAFLHVWSSEPCKATHKSHTKIPRTPVPSPWERKRDSKVWFLVRWRKWTDSWKSPTTTRLESRYARKTEDKEFSPFKTIVTRNFFLLSWKYLEKGRSKFTFLIIFVVVAS